MRLISTLPNIKANLIIILMGLFCSPGLKAQQTTMKDYVLFGGNSTYASGYVQLGSSANVQGGAIGSYKLVKTTGNATIGANVYSGGTIVFSNSNIVTGSSNHVNTRSSVASRSISGKRPAF